MVQSAFCPSFYKPTHSTSESLMLVTRQLHLEVETLLSSTLGATEYEADVLFIKNVGLFLNWLRVPVLRNNIASVRTTFRICNAPEWVMDTRVFNRRMWMEPVTGPPTGFWGFHYLLHHFLAKNIGPWPKKRLRQG